MFVATLDTINPFLIFIFCSRVYFHIGIANTSLFFLNSFGISAYDHIHFPHKAENREQLRTFQAECPDLSPGDLKNREKETTDVVTVI